MTKQPTSKAGEMDWEKEFEESFYNSSKNNDYGWLASMMNGGDSGDNIKAFIRTTINQAIAQERERIIEEVLSLYKKNYSHPTREYRDTDAFRDKVLHIITNNHE